MKNYIIFASMGFELVGLIIGCFYLGEYLDRKYNSKGLIFVGLSFAALIGWLWRVIWLLRRMQKQEEKQDAGPKGPVQ
ncbi:AtpZ/AtpI family protein [Bdellovibrio reynosensis]|uniref:AtpZ/AtpI family protein n=1 Tax=Bdellovibrio reynosensis TaxID=2835041 RepID=A0ABY4C9N8_9BACT|nr:AtpZ/AtpI family protein [Bdellovibrio reynosensis]UOF00391.1 AtpZ/AtpI family protein [Bdellovibrio reynosensis]